MEADAFQEIAALVTRPSLANRMPEHEKAKGTG
jgi:hypothetical protein